MSDLQDELARFLQGKWQKTLPDRPGEYPKATLDGDPAGPGLVYRDRDGTLKSHTPWIGYWWSEPYPKLPPVHENLQAKPHFVQALYKPDVKKIFFTYGDTEHEMEFEQFSRLVEYLELTKSETAKYIKQHRSK